jgi:hypothetical protein
MIPLAGSQHPLSLSTARIVWLAFLVAACGFILLAHAIRPVPSTTPAPAFKWILAAVAAVDIVVIGLIRRSLMERSSRGEAAAAKAGWSVAQMMGFASAMSIVLFGFLLSMMREGWFSTAFYVAGLLLLASYWPQPAE